MYFVCFSVNNWEKRRARKQQFMLHLSLRPDVGGVLYVEPALNMWRSLIFFRRERATAEGRCRWQRAWTGQMEAAVDSEKLFIYTPLSLLPGGFRFLFFYRWNLRLIHFFLRLRLRRRGFKDVVLWLYHPFDAPLLNWFKPRRAACFDWAEMWSEYFLEYKGSSRKMVAACEERVIRSCDAVFVTSQRLLDIARPLNPRSRLLRDGTVPDIFRAFDGSVPDDLKKIPRPIIGYAGTIYDRVDQELISALSQRFESSSFVFVGNIQADRIDVRPMRALKNVYFLGVKPYASLPGYIMNFDVCMVPYVLDPRTAAPTKIYDYLAAGKPIVATALPALAYLSAYVALAATPQEFMAALARSLKEADPAAAERRRQFARENSWAARAQEIMDAISQIS